MLKTVFIVIDGFGYNPNQSGNAILAAKTPNLDYLWSNFPHTLLKAAEEEVGLSFGQIGNSEVGHQAIGTGRVVPSPHQRINLSIQDGSFYKNPSLLEAINYAKEKKSKLHIMGMISTAGVHADLNYVIAVLNLAKKKGLKNVYLHPILDGRDTGPREAEIYLRMLDSAIQKASLGKIATISGRAYAMDRNKNWERTQMYYEVLVGISKKRGNNHFEIVRQAYSQGKDDEFVIPTIIDPNGNIQDGNSIIFTNFRGDRARQITHAFTDQDFKGFNRASLPKNIMFATMTQYEKGLNVKVAFLPLDIKNTLSEVLQKKGFKQLHIAETEKYAHVTYFLNGGREEKLANEDFINIPSYPAQGLDQHPEMRAQEITNYVLEDLNKGIHDFIVINFANPDMIGHTGHFNNTVRAVEVVDSCIGKISQKVLSLGGLLFITADHGNAEQKIDIKTKKESKDHTTNPVPFIMAANQLKITPNPQRITFGSNITGILQDVAPTILSKMGLSVPQEMIGVRLF